MAGCSEDHRLLFHTFRGDMVQTFKTRINYENFFSNSLSIQVILTVIYIKFKLASLNNFYHKKEHKVISDSSVDKCSFGSAVSTGLAELNSNVKKKSHEPVSSRLTQHDALLWILLTAGSSSHSVTSRA